MATKKKSLDRYLIAATLAAGAAAAVYAMLPKAVPVELAKVARGRIQVTVDEAGLTRPKETYVIAAPLAGRSRRIELHPGDEVKAGQTVVARIDPADPVLLDSRSKSEALARVKAADAALKQASANLERAEAAHDFAGREFERASKLNATGAISGQEFEQAALRRRTAAADRRSATFAVRIARFELETAESVLGLSAPTGNGGPASQGIEVHAPVDGIVLRVFQESSLPTAAGTPLVEVGDPDSLEVVVDVLSTDAIRIKAGMEVTLSNWGGDRPLSGHVRLVEPAAYTKVSALGVEEQRVNVIVAIDSPREDWQALMVGFRVDARILVRRIDDALTVPSAAMIRRQDGFAVFRVTGGKAVLSKIEIGHDNGAVAEIAAGLSEGDTVVLYPGDRVSDGVRVAAAP